jgi:hypothetical protein
MNNWINESKEAKRAEALEVARKHNEREAQTKKNK